jgi:hypothetical protein
MQQWHWSHVSVVGLENDYCMTCIDTQTCTTSERLLYDVHRYTHTTREQLLYDVHTHARLLHDYYTTYTDTDIDRYRHTHTQHTHTHTIHTHNTHTQHTHNTHTHTHTTHTHTHTHTHTTQEAVNYVAVEVRRAARSGKLCSCGPKVTGGKGSGSRL